MYSKRKWEEVQELLSGWLEEETDQDQLWKRLLDYVPEFYPGEPSYRAMSFFYTTFIKERSIPSLDQRWLKTALRRNDQKMFRYVWIWELIPLTSSIMNEVEERLLKDLTSKPKNFLVFLENYGVGHLWRQGVVRRYDFDKRSYKEQMAIVLEDGGPSKRLEHLISRALEE